MQTIQIECQGYLEMSHLEDFINFFKYSLLMNSVFFYLKLVNK